TSGPTTVCGPRYGATAAPYATQRQSLAEALPDVRAILDAEGMGRSGARQLGAQAARGRESSEKVPHPLASASGIRRLMAPGHDGQGNPAPRQRPGLSKERDT